MGGGPWNLLKAVRPNSCLLFFPFSSICITDLYFTPLCRFVAWESPRKVTISLTMTASGSVCLSVVCFAFLSVNQGFLNPLQPSCCYAAILRKRITALHLLEIRLCPETSCSEKLSLSPSSLFSCLASLWQAKHHLAILDFSSNCFSLAFQRLKLQSWLFGMFFFNSNHMACICMCE